MSQEDSDTRPLSGEGHEKDCNCSACKVQDGDWAKWADKAEESLEQGKPADPDVEQHMKDTAAG